MSITHYQCRYCKLPHPIGEDCLSHARKDASGTTRVALQGVDPDVAVRAASGRKRRQRPMHPAQLGFPNL